MCFNVLNQMHDLGINLQRSHGRTPKQIIFLLAFKQLNTFINYKTIKQQCYYNACRDIRPMILCKKTTPKK